MTGERSSLSNFAARANTPPPQVLYRGGLAFSRRVTRNPLSWKAKAAAAELAAAKKREEDERRARAAEAEQQAKAAEAERKAAEARQKADEAARNKAAAEAAALRAASEKQARQAETERKKAELASAQEAACKKEQGKFEELVAKGSEGSGIDDLKSFSRTVTCDRLGPQVVAALDKFTAEAAKRAATLPNSPELIRSPRPSSLASAASRAR